MSTYGETYRYVESYVTAATHQKNKRTEEQRENSAHFIRTTTTLAAAQPSLSFSFCSFLSRVSLFAVASNNRWIDHGVARSRSLRRSYFTIRYQARSRT
jgi:hypothetical protein